LTTSLGIDVGGARKGYDIVCLDAGSQVVAAQRHVSLEALSQRIEALRPTVVGIDSPPAWAVGATRRTEAALLGLGLQLYRTPWLAEMQANRFYGWMVHGFAAFEAARALGYALFSGSGCIEGRALEVFPHATATVLNRHKRPGDIDKHVWRRQALDAQGVDTAVLMGNDQVDAALCALTGLLALEGRYCWAGAPDEGVIVLPCPVSELAGRMPWVSARGTAMMSEFR